jgi:hypothetical protein
MKWQDNHEGRVGKSMIMGSRGLSEITIQTVALRNWENAWKPSVEIRII